MFHLTLLPPRYIPDGTENSKTSSKHARFNSVAASVLLARLHQSPHFCIEKFAVEALNLLKVTQNESLTYALFAAICNLMSKTSLNEKLKSDLLEQLISKALSQPTSPIHPLLLLDYLINRIFPVLYSSYIHRHSSFTSNQGTPPKESIPLEYIDRINEHWFSWFQTRETTLLSCMVDWFCNYPEGLIQFIKKYGFGDIFTLIHSHYNLSFRVLPVLVSILNEEKELLQVFKLHDGGLWASHLLRKSLRSPPVVVRQSIKELISMAKSKHREGARLIPKAPLLGHHQRQAAAIPAVDGRALPVPKQQVPPQPRQSPVKPYIEPHPSPSMHDEELPPPMAVTGSISDEKHVEPIPPFEPNIEPIRTTELTKMNISIDDMFEKNRFKSTDGKQPEEVVTSSTSLLPKKVVSLSTPKSDKPNPEDLALPTTINLDLLKSTGVGSGSSPAVDPLPFPLEADVKVPSSLPSSSLKSLTESPVSSPMPSLLPAEQVPISLPSSSSLAVPIPSLASEAVVEEKAQEMKVAEPESNPDATEHAPTTTGPAEDTGAADASSASMYSEKCKEVLEKIKTQAPNWFVDVHSFWMDGVPLSEAMEIARALYGLLQSTLPQLDPVVDPPHEDQSPSTPAHCLRCLYLCMTHPRLMGSTKSHKGAPARHPGKPTKWVLDTSVPHKRASATAGVVQYQDRIQSMLVEMGFLTELVGILENVFDSHVLEYTCCCLQVLVNHPKNYFLSLLVPEQDLEMSSKMFKLLLTVRYSSNLGIQRNSRAVFHTLAKLDGVKDIALDTLRGSVWEHVIN